MKNRQLAKILATFMIVVGVAAVAAAQSANYTISAPYTYKNLSIFLIHGKDESKKGNILTLQEAMERELFRVYETSEVNELEVENLSKEFDVLSAFVHPNNNETAYTEEAMQTFSVAFDKVNSARESSKPSLRSASNLLDLVPVPRLRKTLKKRQSGTGNLLN